MEPTAVSTVEATTAAPPGRDWGGEGEGQHRHKRHTEELLRDRLLTSVNLMEVYAEWGAVAFRSAVSREAPLTLRPSSPLGAPRLRPAASLVP
jgi:hypothetical protein